MKNLEAAMRTILLFLFFQNLIEATINTFLADVTSRLFGCWGWALN
jgi:hypothetical protein